MTISTVIQEESSTEDSNFSLKQIIQTLPREVFIKNPRKAWSKLFVNVLLLGLGYWGMAVSPWYLLPLLWLFLGTALTGFFVIGHDCGHRSFSNRNWINDSVGHVMFLPLIYPFHSWRILHNHHHKHTNKLEVDNAWDPLTPENYQNMSPLVRWIYRRVRGRFWWLGSIGHCVRLHFNWTKFAGKQRGQVRFSVIFVVLGGAIALTTLLITTGIWGLVKFWLVPWLIYHYWMSTFTLIHHTTPDITFQPAATWNEALAQLSGTVHCDYPRWVEFLCHDINVHVPHHISTGIPWYNLRQAHQSLQENWGDYLYETRFSWSLMKRIGDRCHLYDAQNSYQSFKDYQQKEEILKMRP